MKNADNLKIDSGILLGIDLSNSLNGGSSEIENWFSQTEGGYEFTVRAPGVAPEDLMVEVVQNRILVYYMFPMYVRSGESRDNVARMIADFVLPADADFESVDAVYDEDKKMLRIVIPYNTYLKNYRRKIEVER